MLPFVEGNQQAAAATAGLEEYAGAGAATDLHDALVMDGVFNLNAFGGHSDFGMETFCGASGVAATDLPAAMFFDGAFRLHDFEGHGRAASVLGTP